MKQFLTKMLNNTSSKENPSKKPEKETVADGELDCFQFKKEESKESGVKEEEILTYKLLNMDKVKNAEQEENLAYLSYNKVITAKEIQQRKAIQQKKDEIKNTDLEFQDEDFRIADKEEFEFNFEPEQPSSNIEPKRAKTSSHKQNTRLI